MAHRISVNITQREHKLLNAALRGQSEAAALGEAIELYHYLCTVHGEEFGSEITLLEFVKKLLLRWAKTQPNHP